MVTDELTIGRDIEKKDMQSGKLGRQNKKRSHRIPFKKWLNLFGKDCIFEDNLFG